MNVGGRDRAAVIGKDTTEHARDFIEARKTTSKCVYQCVTLDPGYRDLRDYWWQRKQVQPKVC